MTPDQAQDISTKCVKLTNEQLGVIVRAAIGARAGHCVRCVYNDPVAQEIFDAFGKEFYERA